MPIQPVSFYIPADIAARIATGDLIRFGGIVRDQAGHIVMHLPEVVESVSNKKLLPQLATTVKKTRVAGVANEAWVAGAAKMPRVAGTLKNRWVQAGVILGTVGIVTYKVYVGVRKRRAKEPDCVRSYNASLIAYIEAVGEGRLELEMVDRLIADFDAVREYTDEGGRIALDFSTQEAELLVELVVDYTSRLAEMNAVDLNELRAQKPDSENDEVGQLRRHLEVQRRLFNEVG